jgi:site-specific recombinase XerC
LPLGAIGGWGRVGAGKIVPWEDQRRQLRRETPRGLGTVSINVRITAVRKLAVEAADNGLLAPELASGITRVKGVASKGVRLGNWLSLKQAQALLNAPDITTTKGLRDRPILAVLLGCGPRRSEVATLTVPHVQQRDGRWCIVDLVGKQARSAAKYRERGARLYAIQDATIACAFAMLAATALGLGTVWVGAFDDVRVMNGGWRCPGILGSKYK